MMDEDSALGSMQKDEVKEYAQTCFVKNAIENCLKKAESTQENLLNSVALKTLKSLKEMKNEKGYFSEKSMAQSEMAIAILEDDFQRIGKKSLAQFGDFGLMNAFDYEELTPQEKIQEKMQNYAQNESRKRGNNLIL